MKKGLIFVLFVVLISSFAFAGGQQEQGEVTIKWPSIWVGKDSKAPAVAALVQQFNEENAGSIKVEVEEQPNYDGYREKIRTSIAAKIIPDFFTINPSPTSLAYYDSDGILDFNEVMDADWKAMYNEGTIAQATHKGMLKSLPYEVAITPVWYNKALFDKAGASIPSNWSEMQDVMAKLKAAGIIPTSQMTGGSNAWTSMLWYSHFVASLGGPSAWDKPLSDPIYVKAAEMLLELYSDGNTSIDAIGGDAGVSGGHFLAGETAMFINGPWYIGRVKNDAPEVYANTMVDSAPAAGSNAGAQIGFLQTNLIAADLRESDPAKHEAIVAFTKWMSAPDNVARISKEAGSMFAIKFDSAMIDDPLQKSFIEAANSAAFTNKHLAGVFKAEVVSEFGQALGKMALGDATPAEFVEMLDKANK
ncbi:MAG: ABC transporter substrate-binding protein [Spirochaetales bacterium]|nr:ABC transporter substrate-binding protein [Spirochaetales bacterium]